MSVFTEFSDIAYSPCGIPFVHGREIPKFEDLFLSTVERYREDGLDMRMETVVTDIDLDRRTITTKNQPEGFDQLILCTGFFWEQPDVPGANLDGIHYVKDIRKSMEFDKQLDSMKRIVVVGAGPVGVEMAGGLAHRGLQVDLVDEGPWVLHEILDPDVAKPVHDSLEARGVTLHLGTKVESFEGNEDGHVCAVVTTDGVLECDAVVTGLHKVPNTKLAEAAGLKLGTTGAVSVDDHMRTSAPGVWAAGDVVEIPHGLNMIPIVGLTGAHAYAQGRVAAVNITGGDLAYDPVWVPWGMVAGDYTIGGFSMGENLAQVDRDPVRAGQGRRHHEGALLPGRRRRRSSSCSPSPTRCGSSAASSTAARASRSAATSSRSRPSAARRSTTSRTWRTSTRRRSARCSSRSRSPRRTRWPSSGRTSWRSR